jgi:hypothetical protein
MCHTVVIQNPPNIPSNETVIQVINILKVNETLCLQFVLETPPISPPQMSDGSPPSSPQPNSSAGNKSQDSVVMMSPVKIVPVSKNGKQETVFCNV